MITKEDLDRTIQFMEKEKEAREDLTQKVDLSQMSDSEDIIKEVVDSIYTKLDIRTEVGMLALEIAIENIQLLDKKQLDYGPRNIGDFDLFGVVVRLNDKLQRIKRCCKVDRMEDGSLVITFRPPSNESLEDSLKDISNYAIIALILQRGLWPKD